MTGYHGVLHQRSAADHHRLPLADSASSAAPGSVDRAPKLPIVYSPLYNISFLKLQFLHPFDSGKYGKVFDTLQK